MPVPTSINDLSTTAASNSPSGSDSPATLDDHIRALASFIATLRDGAYTGSDAVKLTGSQTIAGTKTFSSPIVGSITGNAATATDAGTLDGIDSTGFTRTTGTSELGTSARTNGNVGGGFAGGLQLRNAGVGINTSAYLDFVLHNVVNANIHGVDTGDGGSQLQFGTTPPGDPNVDRRAQYGRLRNDGVWEGVGFLPTGGAGAIGTYMLLRRNSSADLNNIIAGSELYAAGLQRASDSVATVQSSGTVFGTWRCLSYAPSSGSLGAIGLYVRIS